MEETYHENILRERGKRIARSLRLRRLNKIISTGCYEKIADSLRSTNPEKATQFLSQFYGRAEEEEDTYFPNGVALGKYINRILNIPWFRPSRQYTPRDLKRNVATIAERFKIKKKLDTIVTAHIGEADMAYGMDSVRRAAERTAQNTTRSGAGLAAADTAWGIARSACKAFSDKDPIWGPEDSACAGAEYIISQDIPSLKSKYPENPFEALIRVYEKGLWPAGIEGSYFVIWHPEVKKPRKTKRS